MLNTIKDQERERKNVVYNKQTKQPNNTMNQNQDREKKQIYEMPLTRARFLVDGGN